MAHVFVQLNKLAGAKGSRKQRDMELFEYRVRKGWAIGVGPV